jgi:hypothetical protein
MRPEPGSAVPHAGLRRSCSRRLGLGGSAPYPRAAEFIDRSRRATDSVTSRMASFPPGRQRSAIASTVESSSPSGEGLDLEPKPDAACCPLCNRSHSDRARPDVTRVLVVEDDDAIANLIAALLPRHRLPRSASLPGNASRRGVPEHDRIVAGAIGRGCRTHGVRASRRRRPATLHGGVAR